MKTQKVLIALITGISMLAFACSKDKGNSASSSNAQFYLTDAPGDFEEVNIDIQSIEIKTEAGFQTVVVNKGVYNLLDFTNGQDTLLGDVDLTTQSVKEIRLILGANNTVKVDGITYPLNTPSAQQSGLKIKLDQNVQFGMDYKFVLDFDAAKSIHLTGSGKYQLHPVIRVFTENVTLGSINGVVSPDSIMTRVYAINNQQDTFSTFAGAGGNFKIVGLAEGVYDVTAESNFGSATKSNVNVFTGADVTVDTLFIQ